MKLRLTIIPCISWLLLSGLPPLSAGSPQVELRAAFRVKYIADGAVYLEAGSNAGLAAGLQLSVKRDKEVAPDRIEAIPVAEIRIIAVATVSAVCEILNARQAVQAGDIAYLSSHDVEVLQGLRSQTEKGKYPQVISFTEGDPLEEEMRQYVPRPPSPEINRLRGRIGFEYSTLRDQSAGRLSSTQAGLVLRADMTRLGGTFWNFSGYWRGRMNSRAGGTQQQTLNDLINRTYHLSFSYQNPGSRWVAGAGRLYLPWATSISSIDGGYLGRKLGKQATVGAFGGTTPDPTSWNYQPNRQVAGGFINFEGGSFENLHYSSTSGAAVSRVSWKPDRQFGFFENALLYKHSISIYHTLEADLLSGSAVSTGGGSGLALSRSYLTVRIEPSRRISVDVSHNYFREIPTFDTRLISTGMVDKLLFQGVSAGVRVALPHSLIASASLGRSSKTGDQRHALNQMYGLTMSRIWKTGIRADFRYTRFDSSFGRGSYRSISFSREFLERFRMDVQIGQQSLTSSMTQQGRSRYVNSMIEWFIGCRYFLGAGFSIYRGDTQNYSQWYLNLGYRF